MEEKHVYLYFDLHDEVTVIDEDNLSLDILQCECFNEKKGYCHKLGEHTIMKPYRYGYKMYYPIAKHDPNCSVGESEIIAKLLDVESETVKKCPFYIDLDPADESVGWLFKPDIEFCEMIGKTGEEIIQAFCDYKNSQPPIERPKLLDDEIRDLQNQNSVHTFLIIALAVTVGYMYIYH